MFGKLASSEAPALEYLLKTNQPSKVKIALFIGAMRETGNLAIASPKTSGTRSGVEENFVMKNQFYFIMKHPTLELHQDQCYSCSKYDRIFEFYTRLSPNCF